MGLSNYGELSNRIISHSKRTNLSASDIADFVLMTEQKIDSSDLRLQSEENHETALLATDDRYLNLPPRFKSMREMAIVYGNRKQNLSFLSPKRMKFANEQGRPRAFTITDTIEFDVIPDQNYEVQMWFNQTLDALDPTDPTSTNAILTKYPLIYLMGAVAEVFMFNLDEERAAAYNNRFYQYILMANQQEDLGRFPSSGKIMPVGSTP